MFCELRHEFNWTKIEFRNPNHVGSRHQLYFNWGYHQIVRKHHNGSCILSQELAFLALLRGSRGGTQQQNFPPKQVPKKKKNNVLVLSKGKSVVPLVHVTQVESVPLKGSVFSCKASPAWLGGWHQLHEGSTVMPSGFVQEWGLHQNGTFTGKVMIHQPWDSGVPEFRTDANLEVWGQTKMLWTVISLVGHWFSSKMFQRHS